MIGPAPIPGSLEAITAVISGQTISDVWNNNNFRNDEDIGFGVGNLTSDQPSISGHTAGTISDSTEPVAVDAWHDYVENEPSSVSSTTGGIIDGSEVTTINWSIKDNGSSLEAVTPVEVPIGQAAVSISNALGVAMDWNIISPTTAGAIATALGAAGVIYDEVKGTVKAWRDKLGNILFPKAAINAVGDVLEDEGIGGATKEIILPPDTGIEYCTFGVTNGVEFIQYDGIHKTKVTISHAVRASINIYNECVLASDSPFTVFMQTAVYDTTTHEWGDYQAIYSASSWDYTKDNKIVYYLTGTGGNELDREIWRRLASGGRYSASASVQKQVIAWYMEYGEVEEGGTYPDGTAPSAAEVTYTPATYPIDGSIVTNPDGTDSIDVVTVHVAEGVSTIGDDAVVTSPTDTDTLDDLNDAPIPLPIPDTKPSNPAIPLANPTIINQELINALVDELANTLDPQPPQSSGLIPVPPLPGIGDPATFPSIIPQSGPGFIHVYNPTPAEFVAFGTWLWVTYADATIDKILNNPFDGVIGAHELYATPNRDGRDNIRSAFLTCPTTADLVTNRYSEIDCGTVIVPEFYGNYLDYSPYSQAYIYLPFIGINEVSIDDIVGHAVNIRYRIDSYSGSCIAMIFVAKDGYQNLCYQFAGSCSVEVPMAGGSQAAIKAGMMQAEAYARAAMIQAGANVVGGVGSALMGNIGGVLSSLSGVASNYAQAQAGVEAARVANKSSVQHSGQFGSSHGAMGEKIPFIIIRNPIQVKVVNYNEDYGFPAHKRVIVGGCRGYLRVREVNVISAHATDEEKLAIEMALKGGVYVS